MRQTAIGIVGLLYVATIAAWLLGLVPATQQCTASNSGLGAMQCRILLHGVWALAAGIGVMVVALLISESRDDQTAVDMERYTAIGGLMWYVLVAGAWYIAYRGL